MELLWEDRLRVRIPGPSDRIYKEECCISFETPKSEGGLFVDLNSFLAFGREYVLWNYQKTDNPVYLHIKQIPKLGIENLPPKKRTLPPIDVDGGSYSKQIEYEEFYSIVILPGFITLPFPSGALPETVRLTVDGVLAAGVAERKEQVSPCTARNKRISAFAESLQQLDYGVKVPPSGWKCANCDHTQNLWLNLVDGTILCGSKISDKIGGNGHAIEHYIETKYPLVVRLRAITADLKATDVYSFPENGSVEDPYLAKHLEHFGIDFSVPKKTEMTAAENLNFDWNRIQEDGKELQLLFGPGYTGLANIGNSCYLGSVVQAVFSTVNFQHKYYNDLPLDEAFLRATTDPPLDLNTQLAKLAHGIFSGKYSYPQVAERKIAGDGDGDAKFVQDGISPRMFKSLLGAGHPKFTGARQQDVSDFFHYFMDQVEYASGPLEDPSRCFRFSVQERILCCASNKVRYTEKVDNMLSLSIPLQDAVNKDEVLAYEKKKEKAAEKLDNEEVIRPRVPLSACLGRFFAPEEVQDFFSTAINSKTIALKTTKLATFPDYLVLHMRKFVFDGGWVPKKLDVFIDVPDEIDISSMRGTGLQPGEALLPCTEEESPEVSPDVSLSPDGSLSPDTEEESQEVRPSADRGIVAQLLDMGFSKFRCEKAAVHTSNAGVEEAMNWLLSHMDDPDTDAPSASGKGSIAPESVADEVLVDTLMAVGFPPDIARTALKITGGDVARAADWILSDPNDPNSKELESRSASELSPSVPGVSLPDGPGKYQLLAFISHMGTSIESGHYVVHIKREGRWVIYNDNKVALSEDPPKDMGYLYFFERLDM